MVLESHSGIQIVVSYKPPILARKPKIKRGLTFTMLGRIFRRKGRLDPL